MEKTNNQKIECLRGPDYSKRVLLTGIDDVPDSVKVARLTRSADHWKREAEMKDKYLDMYRKENEELEDRIKVLESGLF